MKNEKQQIKMQKKNSPRFIFHFSLFTFRFQKGQSLVELLIAIGISVIVIPALLTGIVASREGRAQQKERVQALAIVKETSEALRNARERGWATFAVNGTYHPVISGNAWTLASGADTVNGFTRQVIISDVQRNASGAIVTSGGVVDTSSKKVDITVSWQQPYSSSVTTSAYLTRYLDNLSWVQTTEAEFNNGTINQTLVTNTAGGEITIGLNNKAKWCTPSFSTSTIDLPDGPPVAVTATASAATSTPNDVFVATSPFATNSAKLAYVNVSANADPPVSTLKGTFTLDASKYSDPGLVPTGINLDNNFKTNDVKYYKSASGKIYALMATNLADHEVIAVQVNDGTPNGAYQDVVNKIYKYWTFFNTKIHATSSTDSGFLSPSANATDTGGDGNGFLSNPTRAYSDNASFAVDTDSGNGTGTSCTGADKDKHRFYNYDITMPGGATINGIEVRLDARVDSTTGTPRMCVQLSWDGGTTWTTAQTTANLGTNELSYTLGGPSDTWGRTWSDSNFTNANFRVRIINIASNISRDFSLDWAAVKVYYSGGVLGSNDEAPFGYGGKSITVLGDRGYVSSGGYLYVFDLSTIDSKSPTTGLDQVGCRIELDGFDCEPGNGTDRKYSAGETGTSWSTTTSPAHNDCSDGGNIELYANNDLYGVTVGANNYIYVAVGAGTNPELNIVNASSIPDGVSSPAVNNASCGRITGGNSSWKRIGALDFNNSSGTEEAANSVYAKSDGTRAYISSNGGIDANNDGQPDSKQFYVINTSTKSSPAFLAGGGSGPTSGFYYGTSPNDELYPRRSLTVLNGQRVVLVGRDGTANGDDAFEYQVLNSTNEASPSYCGGVNYDQGFNDLTYVTEADLDTFVYMVANTTLNELKIIQGGPDGTYSAEGTYESAAFNAGFATAFNRLTVTSSVPANTSLQYQVAGADPVSGNCSGSTYNYLGPDGTASTYFTGTGGPIFQGSSGAYKNPAQCFKYKAFFSTTDFNSTPVLNDTTVNYSP